MKALINTAGFIAIIATGCVKAETSPFEVYRGCLNQAKSAYALVHAREQGKPRADIVRYVEENEKAEYHPMLHRIIDKVYDNPKLNNQAAYDGELVYCMSHSTNTAAK